MREFMEEGVGGFFGLGCGGGEFLFVGCVMIDFCVWGFEGLLCWIGMFVVVFKGWVKFLLVFDFLNKVVLKFFFFGIDWFKKGDGFDLVVLFFILVKDLVELVGGFVVVVGFLWWSFCIDVLFLRCCILVLFLGCIFLKNVFFDVVMGVVGVFGICFDGGGERFLLLWVWRVVILVVVGVLRGLRVMGGNCSGCKFFFDWVVVGFFLRFSFEVCIVFLLFGLCWSLVGVELFVCVFDIFVVELLWMLLVL